MSPMGAKVRWNIVCDGIMFMFETYLTLEMVS